MSTRDDNPYAAPEATDAPRPVGDTGGGLIPTEGFRSNAVRTSWLSRLLLAGMVLAVAGLASDLAQISLLNKARAGRAPTDAEASFNDLHQAIVGGTQALVQIATAVAFGMWTYRAYGNLPALGGRQLRMTPGWAVGSYFIPILNLFRPYQAVVEVWKVSDPAVGVTTQHSRSLARATPLLGLWWTLWLISGIYGRLTFRASLAENPTVDDLVTGTWLSLFGNVLGIVLCVAARAVVLRVNARQEEKAERLRAGLVPGAEASEAWSIDS
jgi:hypothetical protein